MLHESPITLVDIGNSDKRSAGRSPLHHLIDLDPAPKWQEYDLKIMSKHNYCEEKIDLIEQGKLAPNGTSQKKVYEGRDFGKRTTHSGASGYQDKWKKRRDQDQKGGFREAAEVVVSVAEVFVTVVSLDSFAFSVQGVEFD